MQWLVQRNSSLILWSRKRFSTQMFMCWWPSGRLNASRLQTYQETNNSSHHQLVSVKSSCPLSVNRLYRTERCALRPSRPRLPWLRTKPTSRNMHEGSNVALHLPWYVVVSAAIAVRYWRAEHVLKDSVRRGFCRASLAKGSPTQRIVEFSPMSCSLCGAQLSENGAALAHMAAHLRTFLPHGDLVQ